MDDPMKKRPIYGLFSCRPHTGTGKAFAVNDIYANTFCVRACLHAKVYNDKML